jgi:NADP-dependent 3-hydroxy acid dehydrogenase YdfG
MSILNNQVTIVTGAASGIGKLQSLVIWFFSVS